jgi:hypothetical protein
MLAFALSVLSSEETVLTAAFLKAEEELFANDLARLDKMFATHSCRHLYLDAGTNIGVQIRKVLQPALYPPSGAGHSEHQFRLAARYTEQVMASQFGSGSPRCDVCAVGIEPNPKHAARLRKLESSLTAAGFGVVIFRAAATDAHSAAAIEATDEAAKHEYWAAHLQQSAATAANGTRTALRVRTMDLGRLVQETDLRLRSQAGAGERGRLVMKMECATPPRCVSNQP